MQWIFFQDVTSLYTALCVMGPFSRALMQKLTPEAVDSVSFPFMSCRKMDVACAPDILTMNLTHTGELGFIFYIPNEFALHVYDAIIKGWSRVRSEALWILRTESRQN